MNRLQHIQTFKERLSDTDYIALKAYEGADMAEYGDWKADRQALRDEINALEAMTDEEYAEKYADEETADNS